MKKLIILLFILLAGICPYFVEAQTEITEGYIKMEITDATSDDEQTAAMLEMMKGSQTEFYFTSQQSLVKANMLGGMFNMTTLVNNNTEEQTLLVDAMGNKMMVESTKEDRESLNDEQAETMREFVVEFDESDVKTIVGHSCVKAKIRHPEMEAGISFEAYIAKDIKASNKLIQGMNYIDLQGFPLEYIMDAGPVKMVFSAVEFLTKVDQDIFDLKTGGYKKMSWEEFMSTMGQMSGGFGF